MVHPFQWFWDWCILSRDNSCIRYYMVYVLYAQKVGYTTIPKQNTLFPCRWSAPPCPPAATSPSARSRSSAVAPRRSTRRRPPPRQTRPSRLTHLLKKRNLNRGLLQTKQNFTPPWYQQEKPLQSIFTDILVWIGWNFCLQCILDNWFSTQFIAKFLL